MLAQKATWLRVLRHVGRSPWWVLEQPSSSRLWQLECMMALTLATAAVKVTTWRLGFWSVM